MAKSRLSRRKLLVGAVPLVAAPALAKLQVDGRAEAMPPGHEHHGLLHAAMFGKQAPAVGGPHDLDALLYPPAALPHRPGRVRDYILAASDRDIEIAPGITFPAWTYNGTVPGPVVRVTEDDLLRVTFVNAGSHPHTIHFHGIHPANMDGVFEVVRSGETFTYEFPARPHGMHLYHCHSTPLKKHIHKGLYGAFIIDPAKPRKPAQELVMVMNGYDTDGDGGNNFYTVNGRTFYYSRPPFADGAYLPRESHRVRPPQLVPPAR
jgi:FtsP/CotA-like multicopper oxidase with cupredoxin domain